MGFEVQTFELGHCVTGQILKTQSRQRLKKKDWCPSCFIQLGTCAPQNQLINSGIYSLIYLITVTKQLYLC